MELYLKSLNPNVSPRYNRINSYYCLQAELLEGRKEKVKLSLMLYSMGGQMLLGKR